MKIRYFVRKLKGVLIKICTNSRILNEVQISFELTFLNVSGRLEND